MSGRSTRVLALGSFLCMLLAGFLLISGWTAKADGNDQSGALVGTWILHVAPPEDSGLSAFDVLSTHAFGGTSVFSPDPSFPGLYTSTGQGVWRQTGDANTFSTTHWEILYSNPGGAVLHTVKVNTSIVTNGDTFTGKGQVLVCDAGFANCVNTGGPGDFAQLTGRRVSVTPIQ